jgi:pimeloyl-ACP methyl ester carboxylesterase
MKSINFTIQIEQAMLYVQHLQNPHNTTGKTIVFLHDSLGCTTLWRDFPVQVANKLTCDVLLYDRQGYGQSSTFTEKREIDYLQKEADTLAKLLKECAIEKAILFGHSDGGSIALLAAALHPQQIEAIITEGAHVFVEDITLAGIKEAKAAYSTLKGRLEKYHGSNTQALFEAWTETWLSDEFRHWNIEPYLPKINCPVMVLQGEEDEFGTAKQVEAIEKGVSGKAVAHILPNLGHTPHKQASEQTINLLTPFFR